MPDQCLRLPRGGLQDGPVIGRPARVPGEAKSAEMIGEALSKNPGFVQLRRLEADRDIATTLARSNNRLYLNADSLLLKLDGDEAEPVVGTK